MIISLLSRVKKRGGEVSGACPRISGGDSRTFLWGGGALEEARWRRSAGGGAVEELAAWQQNIANFPFDSFMTKFAISQNGMFHYPRFVLLLLGVSRVICGSHLLLLRPSRHALLHFSCWTWSFERGFHSNCDVTTTCSACDVISVM